MPPCANEDKSSSLGIFAQGGYLAGPGGGDEVYPRKLFRIFNTPDDIYLNINDLEENRVKKAMDK